MTQHFHFEPEDNSVSSKKSRRLAEPTVCCMSLRLSADPSVWTINVIGEIISHAASDIVTLFVLDADSPVCSATSWWMDKTKSIVYVQA